MTRIEYFAISTLLCVCLGPSAVHAQFHVIGWQTFENAIPGNNDSGVTDNTPDTNSTFDSTPVGSNSAGLYLTGAIGPDASTLGWDGFGQSTSNEFLNGPTFGNDLLITDYTLADGSPGTRIGPFGGEGTSAWKFS
ncbi:MAG: hypothetical protein AAF497_07745, partial [Planctomycetota bacterium]